MNDLEKLISNIMTNNDSTRYGTPNSISRLFPLSVWIIFDTKDSGDAYPVAITQNKDCVKELEQDYINYCIENADIIKLNLCNDTEKEKAKILKSLKNDLFVENWCFLDGVYKLNFVNLKDVMMDNQTRESIFGYFLYKLKCDLGFQPSEEVNNG